MAEAAEAEGVPEPAALAIWLTSSMPRLQRQNKSIFTQLVISHVSVISLRVKNLLDVQFFDPCARAYADLFNELVK